MLPREEVADVGVPALAGIRAKGRLARIIHAPGVLITRSPIPSAKRKRGQVIVRSSLTLRVVMGP